MQKTIVGRGVRALGDVAFHNVQNTQYETGPAAPQKVDTERWKTDGK